LSENHSFVDIFFHKLGKIVIIQNNISITQLNNFQKIGLTVINKVVAFNNIENIIIEIQREAIIT